MTIKSTLNNLKHQTEELQGVVTRCSQQDCSSLSPAQMQMLENIHTLILSPLYQQTISPSKENHNTTISNNPSFTTQKNALSSMPNFPTNDKKDAFYLFLKGGLQSLILLSNEPLKTNELPEELNQLILKLETIVNSEETSIWGDVSPLTPNSPSITVSPNTTTHSEADLEKSESLVTFIDWEEDGRSLISSDLEENIFLLPSDGWKRVPTPLTPIEQND